VGISYGASVVVVVISDVVFYGGGNALPVFEHGGAVERRKKISHRGHGEKHAEIAEKKKGGGPGLPASHGSPFGESPANLTEGGWPVVCWPGYETPERGKKFHVAQKKLNKILWKTGT